MEFQFGGGVDDGEGLITGRGSIVLVAGNVPVVPQALHSSGGEWQACCSGTSLTVQDAGDLSVGVMHGQSPDEVDGVLVGAQSGLFPGGQRHPQIGEGAALPAEHEVGVAGGPVEGDGDLGEQGAQEFLAVPVGGGRRGPDHVEVAAQREDPGLLFRGQGFRMPGFAARQFGFGSGQGGQRLLPRGLQATRHEPVLGVEAR